MSRVPFRASSSPLLLAETIRHHLQACREQYPETVALLEKAFDVDDLIFGVPIVKKAIQVYEEARKIFSEAGMKIRKWASNSEELGHQLVRDNAAIEKEAGDAIRIKLIGVPWERAGDCIYLSPKNASEFAVANPSTKCTVLQTFGRMYDSLGYFAPFTLKAKLVFQDLWKKSLHGMNAFQMTNKRWNSWCTQLPELNKVQVPRFAFWHSFDVEGSIDTHAFCDASPRAYGVYLYVRKLDASGLYYTRLLISKSRVAHLRPISLPRLELPVCVIGARLVRYAKTTAILEDARVSLWTDCLVALHWITRAATKRDQFVEHRVAEIPRLTAPTDWNHCSGKDNPEDLVTRGISAKALLYSDQRWHGPSWLLGTNQEFPDPHIDDVDPKELVVSQETLVCPCDVTKHEQLLTIANYSSLRRLLRVTVWILRFLQNSQRQEPSASGPHTATEIMKAERYLMRHVQLELFSTEVRAFSVGQTVSSTPAVLRFSPFIDDEGLLRVGGRLHRWNSSIDVKNPILLPAWHKFTFLIILAAHHRTLHGAVAATLTETREWFWVVKGRQTEKRVLAQCLTCSAGG